MTSYFLFCFSVFKFGLQVVLLLAFLWNSPLAEKNIGGRPARAWVGEGASEAIARFVNEYVPVRLSTEDGGATASDLFVIGAIVFTAGMLANVLAVFVYVARYSTPALGKAIAARLGLTAFAFTFTVVHPEAMRLVATRRKDAMALRSLGFLPALLLDLPIASLCVRFLFTQHYGMDSLVLWVAILSTAHGLLFFYSALIATITADLRRTPQVEDGFERVSVFDVFGLAFSTLHFALMGALVALYFYGWRYGDMVGFEADQAASCRNFLYWAIAILAASCASNLSACCSFLNHYIFSHADVAEYSYFTGVVLLLGTIDPAWLNFLSKDETAVREVKRVGALVSIVSFYLPIGCLQLFTILFAKIDWTLLDDHTDRVATDLGSGAFWYTPELFDHIIDGSTVQLVCAAATLIVGVGKSFFFASNMSQRKMDDEYDPSPYVHTINVLGAQWQINRQPSDDSYRKPSSSRRGGGGGGSSTTSRSQRGTPSSRRRAAAGRRPTHHMGYALDADGNYTVDANGEYVLGDGVQYIDPETNEYVQDADGSFMLEDADGVLIEEGYGPNGDEYGGYVYDDDGGATSSNVTSEYGSEQPRAGDLWFATCLKRCLIRWDGVQGVFVSLHDPESPFLWLQAHEVRDLPKRGAKGQPQVKVGYDRNDLSAWNLTKAVEQNISNEPHGEAALRDAAAAAGSGLVLGPGRRPPRRQPRRAGPRLRLRRRSAGVAGALHAAESRWARRCDAGGSRRRRARHECVQHAGGRPRYRAEAVRTGRGDDDGLAMMDAVGRTE